MLLCPMCPDIDTVRRATGERIHLECESGVNVVWSYGATLYSHPFDIVINGQIVDDNAKWFALDTSILGKANLVVLNATTNNSGIYTCTEDDGFGEEHYVRLIVKGKMFQFSSVIAYQQAFELFSSQLSLKANLSYMSSNEYCVGKYCNNCRTIT